jgi:DNA-binding NarL/FixJ family response regulator
MAKTKSQAAVDGPKRILLVDDHPMLRQGIQQYLQQDQALTICGQAGSTSEALERMQQLKPDLILVDIGLPGRDGLELIKDIRALDSTCAILVFSMFDEELYAERVLRAGAQGYVMKHESPLKLIQAIHSVLNGEMVTGPGVIQRALRRTAEGRDDKPASPVTLLTDRELEIFRLIGAGHPRNEIARRLNLSVKTFEAHRANIRQKLNLRSAAELLIHATQFIHENNH